MFDSDFNTLHQETAIRTENNENIKDKRKTLVVIMILIIGQIMSMLNTLINNFTIKHFNINILSYIMVGFILFFSLYGCVLIEK